MTEAALLHALLVLKNGIHPWHRWITDEIEEKNDVKLMKTNVLNEKCGICGIYFYSNHMF